MTMRLRLSKYTRTKLPFKEDQIPLKTKEKLEEHLQAAISFLQTQQAVLHRTLDILEDIAHDHPGRVYRSGRAGELRHSTLDISRLADHGWSPHHGLRDGLRNTYRFIVNHKNGA